MSKFRRPLYSEDYCISYWMLHSRSSFRRLHDTVFGYFGLGASSPILLLKLLLTLTEINCKFYICVNIVLQYTHNLMTIVARRLYFLTMLKNNRPMRRLGNLRNNVPSLPNSTTVNHKNYWKKKVSFYEEMDQGSMLR